MSQPDSYEWVKAIIDCGELRWEYKVTGSDVTGRQSFEEDVEDYTEDDIRELTRSMLDVPEDVEIQIEYC